MIKQITEFAEKQRTRKLYQEAFDDPEVFVDYYYSDKCLDNKMIVSEEDGEVISMLHLNPFCVNLCGTAVKSYYVVAVATTKERRHQGHMSRIFEEAFRILKEEKIPFVFLLPVEESIYSWMGFEKICDFATDRIADYEEIKKSFDVYCIRDDAYIRRMNKEDYFRSMDNGEVLPDAPVIMAKITDLEAFNEATDQSFSTEKEALSWLKQKKIYICEEV